MKVICEVNDKKLNVYNSEMFYITKMTEKYVGVSREIYGNDLECGYIPRSHFRPSFCCTTYKYQGKTLTCDYNIYDINAMTRNQLYTALSRAQRLDQIHLKYTDKIFIKSVEPDTPTMIEYIKGKVGYIYIYIDYIIKNIINICRNDYMYY